MNCFIPLGVRPLHQNTYIAGPNWQLRDLLPLIWSPKTWDWSGCPFSLQISSLPMNICSSLLTNRNFAEVFQVNSLSRGAIPTLF